MSSLVEYSFEIEKLAQILKFMQAKRVLIQLPNGLKPYASHIEKLLKSMLPNISIFFSGGDAYGPCDIAFDEAKLINADVIVHYGHPTLGISSNEIPVIYLPAIVNISPKVDIVINEIRRRGYSNVGISGSIQHVNLINVLADELKKVGINVYIGTRHGFPPGIILGCDYTAALAIDKYVDAHLVVAGGIFHALGLRMITDKEVLAYDPYRNTVISASDEYKRRLALKLKQLLDFDKLDLFGIIICKKVGQFNIRLAIKASELLRDMDRQFLFIVVDDVDPEALGHFTDVDAFVNTCCPRLSIDDIDRFNKPIFSLYDLKVMLKKDISAYSLKLE